MISSRDGQIGIIRSLYPETAAGGYTRVDGTVQFYCRLNALLDESMTVVDYGAGRGAWHDDPVPFRRDLRMLRGKVREVIGVDVDAAVEDNPGLDRSIVCAAESPIPLPDSSVDLVISDHTFEHVDHPGRTASELSRILRSGGWICARTPNRWGYIALATSLVPNRRHARVLGELQPGRREADIFPTRYRLNTSRAIKQHFPPESFDDHSYGWSGEPSYFGTSVILARIIKIAGSPLLPRAKLFVFLRKR